MLNVQLDVLSRCHYVGWAGLSLLWKVHKCWDDNHRLTQLRFLNTVKSQADRAVVTQFPLGG